MVRTKEELMAALKPIVGESTDASVLALLEDVSDTMDDYSTKSSKYSELETELQTEKKRYKDRFFIADTNTNPDTSAPEVKQEQTEDVKEDNNPKTYDGLFTPKSESESEVE